MVSLLDLVVPALAAGFLQQADVFDAHVLLDGLAHVVDGQGRHGHGRQGLHFHACHAGTGDGGLDLHHAGLVGQGEGDVDARQGQGS